MLYYITIQGELPDLNTYIKAERTNKYMAVKIKKDATDKVYWAVKECCLKYKTYNRVGLFITYYCKNKRKDKDNIAFAKKFIFDGLQKAGMIKNDGWDNIRRWNENFEIDKNHPRIEIILIHE